MDPVLTFFALAALSMLFGGLVPELYGRIGIGRTYP